MIDFYLIDSSCPKPKNPDKELVFIKGLPYPIADKLQSKGIIPERFDLYLELRWSLDFVKDIFAKLDSKNSDDKAFKDILKIAINENKGIMAYGD